VMDLDRKKLGQGLTRYDAQDAARIVGLRSDEIEPVLGYPARGPLIHRDDMAF
ncbi:MAG: glutamate 5-kinase, partial [Pseudomonadota bacterium]